MAQFCLVGQAGHKNGEKLLRTALVACEEWRDAQSRKAASRAALADGQPELAAILMAKEGAVHLAVPPLGLRHQVLAAQEGRA